MSATDRVKSLNKAQLRFLLLHAFGKPHRWAWHGVDWAAEVPLARMRTGRLRANSKTRQATITAADLEAIHDCFKPDFPQVDVALHDALKAARGVRLSKPAT